MSTRRKGPLLRLPLAAALLATPVALALNPQPVTAASPGGITLAPQEIRVPGGDQRVTLRLRDMEVAEALRLIAGRAKLSMSIAPDVKGKVDFDFYNERLNRILEIVVGSNGLHFRQVGNSYIVSSSPSTGLGGVRVFQLNYASAADLAKILGSSIKAAGIVPAGAGAAKVDDLITADPRSNSIVVSGNEYFLDQVGKLISRLDLPHEHKIFRLNYIKAEDAATLLTGSLFAGATGTGVKFIPVVRENSLMVVASPEDLRLVGQVLDKVDRRLRQVLIEVKLIELSGTANNLLGVTFDGQSGTLNGSWAPTNGLDLGYNPLQDALTQLRVRINALLRDNKARLLASPSIIAMDSKESKIEITDDIIEKVLIETTVNANNIFTRQNVTLGTAGVTLAITPKINPDGYISMKVDPTISFIRETVRGATNAEILATLKSSRKLQTPEVRVRDSETLIIGGLNQERTTEQLDKIPLLGDIPFLGAMFRRTDKTRTLTELVVLITPKVVPEGDVVPKGGAATPSARP